jgi:hypothetical protein
VAAATVECQSLAANASHVLSLRLLHERAFAARRLRGAGNAAPITVTGSSSTARGLGLLLNASWYALMGTAPRPEAALNRFGTGISSLNTNGYNGRTFWDMVRSHSLTRWHGALSLHLPVSLSASLSPCASISRFLFAPFASFLSVLSSEQHGMCRVDCSALGYMGRAQLAPVRPRQSSRRRPCVPSRRGARCSTLRQGLQVRWPGLPVGRGIWRDTSQHTERFLS